jgi:hypothetical protein
MKHVFGRHWRAAKRRSDAARRSHDSTAFRMHLSRPFPARVPRPLHHRATAQQAVNMRATSASARRRRTGPRSAVAVLLWGWLRTASRRSTLTLATVAGAGWQPAKHGAVALRGATGGRPVVELHHKSRLDALVRNKRCRADGILLSPRRHLYTGARFFRALVSPHSPHPSARAGTSSWAVKTIRTGSRASTARPAYVLASRSFSPPTALSWGYPAPGPDGSVYETGENAVVYAVSGTGAIRWQQTEGIRRRSHRASCRCSAHQVGHRRRGL